MLRATLSSPNKDCVKAIFSGGPLYRLKDRFEDAGIGGAYIDPEGTPFRRFVRVMGSADVSGSGGENVLTNLWMAVLKGAKILVTMDGIPDEDGPAGRYVAGLQDDPQFVWE